MSFAIFIQEGFGSDGMSVYFCNEPPTYEAERYPVLLRGTTEVAEEKEELFVKFIPKNGPRHRRNKANRVPFHRLLSVVEQDEEEKGDE